MNLLKVRLLTIGADLAMSVVENDLIFITDWLLANFVDEIVVPVFLTSLAFEDFLR